MEEEEVERPFLITVPLDAQKQRRLLWVTDFVLSLENMMLIDVFPRVHQFSLCKDLPEFPQIQRRAQLVALKGILTQEDPDVGRYRSFYKLFLTLGDGYDFEELELYDEFSELCALCLQFHILEVLYEDGDLEEAKELLASVDEQEGDEFLDGRLDYVERCIDSFQNRKSVTWSQKAKKDYWNLQARLLSFLDALSQNEPGSVIETLPIPSNLTPKAPTPSPVFSRTKGEEENEDEEENGTLSAHDLRDAFEGSDSSFFSIIEGKDKHVARFLKDRSRPPKKRKSTASRELHWEESSRKGKQSPVSSEEEEEEDLSFSEDLSPEDDILSDDEFDEEREVYAKKKGKRSSGEEKRKLFRNKLAQTDRQDSDTAMKVFSGLQSALMELESRVGARDGVKKRGSTKLKKNSLSPLKSPLSVRPVALKKKKGPLRRPQFGGRRKKFYWTDEEIECLLDGIKKHGHGEWKKILEDPQYTFQLRTTVDLKDKHRNLVKSGKL